MLEVIWYKFKWLHCKSIAEDLENYAMAAGAELNHS